MYLWSCGNLEFRFVSIRCCVWIGALDLVDLDLLESGQPMNVLMFREGVGCSDWGSPPRCASYRRTTHGSGNRTYFRRWKVLEYSCAAKLLWKAGAGWVCQLDNLSPRCYCSILCRVQHFPHLFFAA